MSISQFISFLESKGFSTPFLTQLSIDELIALWEMEGG